MGGGFQMLTVDYGWNNHGIIGGGGGGVSRPSMSAYVLSFLDSMRQRTCFLGHWRT